MLEIGQKAPEFSLPNQDDVVISLKDFKGQKLLIWFSPRQVQAVVLKKE